MWVDPPTAGSSPILFPVFPGGRGLLYLTAAFSRCLPLGGVLWLVLALVWGLPGEADAQLPSVLEVRVTTSAPDGSEPRPLSGVWVEALGSDLGGVTDGEGRVRIRGLPPGLHTLRASHIGFADARVEVELRNGLTTSASLTLAAEPVRLPGIEVVEESRRGPLGGVRLDPAQAPPAARTVADLVESVPGVTVIRRGGPGAPATVSIRGSAADQVLVLVDGIPVNDALTGAADLSVLELSDLTDVVVIPGAASARYGSGALAGVILVETGRPETRGTLAFESRMGAFGELGASLSGGIPLSSQGRWRLEGQARAEEARGDFPHPVPAFRGGGEARRVNSGVRTLRSQAALVRHGEGARARMRVHAEKLERGSPGTVAQPSRTGVREEDRLGANASLEWGTAAAGRRLLLATTSHSAEHRDPSPPFGPAYHSSTQVTDLDFRMEGWHEVGAVAMQAGGVARSRGIRSTALDRDAIRRVRELGGWVEGSWNVGDASGRTSRLPLLLRSTATLRVDLHDLVDDPVASPALGLEAIRGDARLGLRWAHGFSPPSPADLFFQEGVLVRPNPDLAPERVRGEWTVEAAWGGTVGPLRHRLEASVFRADVDGMILWFPDHRFIWSPLNRDVARRGGAASAEIRWPDVGLSVAGSVDRTQVTYAGSTLSGQVAYRPEWRGSVTARKDAGWAELHGTLRSHGARRTVPGSDLNRLDPFTTLDLGVSIPFDLGVRWSGRAEVAVRNALDVSAAFLADYPLPGRWWTLSVRLDRDR